MIRILQHHREHFKKVGVRAPLFQRLRVSEKEYAIHAADWQRSGFSGEEVNKRILAHVLWKRKQKRKALFQKIARGMWPAILVLGLLISLAAKSHCQFSHINTVTVTDGAHTEFAASPFTMTFTGCTVGGSGTNMTVTCSGGGSMTWPSTPGITVCTGTPCTAWGASLAVPLAVNKGGTGADLSNSTNNVVIGGSPFSGAAPGIAGQVLCDNGAGYAPTFCNLQQFIDLTSAPAVVTLTAAPTTLFLDYAPSISGAFSLADGISAGQILSIVCNSALAPSAAFPWKIAANYSAFGIIALGTPNLGSYDLGATFIDSMQSSCGAELMWDDNDGVWQLLNIFGGTTS